MSNAPQNIAERGPFDAFNDDVSDPMYAPISTSPFGGTYGLPLEVSTHRPPAEDHSGDWWGATADREYLDPSVGGLPGPDVGFGWTTGLRPRREMRQAFDGRTLVVAPGQANNPATGPVGRDNHMSRLSAGVSALNTDFLPPMDVIAASFTGARSPIVQEMQRG